MNLLGAAEGILESGPGATLTLALASYVLSLRSGCTYLNYARTQMCIPAARLLNSQS